VLVAHTYNLKYSGGRDQKDWGLKPAPANSSVTLISKKLITEKGLQMTQGADPEFKYQYCKKTKKKMFGRIH
jgi:hypothetical protein